uniref:Uncharacterized protein n=1 Tax=Mola mola TaxID=94237 RepID=A0A3Q3VV53_MOLML
MGANNSTRRVSFESDENDNITVVKGIRLSENVINRMREPAAPSTPAPTPPPSMASTLIPPLVQPVSPPFDPIPSLPPLPPVVEPVAPPPHLQPPVEQVKKTLYVFLFPVDEEALRKKITDELYKDLERDRAKAEQELQAWLAAEKARSKAMVQAEAQSQVKDEVSRILSAERAMAQESLQQSVIRERLAAEDEKRRADQIFAKQLQAREADLQKQDAFYREQVARLEERSAQIYKVTTENYHKAADQVNAKFKQYEMYPVCADLQGQILACYKENIGKTLNCSNIAALYLQCVNNAKQVRIYHP